MARFDFVTPPSKSSLLKFEEQLRLVVDVLPYKLTLEEYIENTFGNLTLVFVDKEFFGVFEIIRNKHSAELHGAIRKDVSKIFKNSRKFKVHIFKTILDALFLDKSLHKIICKVDPDNKGAKGFVLMHGFQKLNNTDRNQEIWKLTREKHVVRKEEKSKSRKSKVSV